jgi:hypothetical protein
MRARGDVVDEPVNLPMCQYAVIVLRTEPCRERLVIAYRDEKTLRDLLAPPSIVALGYSSREEALANIDRCARTIAASQPLSAKAVADTNTRTRGIVRASMRRFRRGFGLAGSPSILHRVLQHGVALTVVFFHSRNALSATLRAFISF